jgi:iron complex outermembrane recepter protein
LKKIALMKFLLLSILIGITSIGLAQQIETKGKISVIINDEKSQPLEGATVEVLRGKDSALVKTGLTDKGGLAEVDDIKPGSYLLKVTMVNRASTFSKPFILSNEQTSVSLPPLTLAAQTRQMEDVTVTTRKPFIQKLNDRIVVNVEGSIISAGSSAFDVLERSPGITIDQNDQIALRGKAGVIIMIDGRLSALSGADLTNYLRSLPSNAIERIDIITNPSAKYEAAGNSGIIDIRMKKDQRLGTNGNITAGYGQGVYPKANVGGAINYRNKKVNVFGNYNYNYRKNLNHLILNRNFFKDGVFVSGDDKDNYTTFPVNAHNSRLGADFFPSKKTIVGFVINSTIIGVISNNQNSSVVVNNLKQPSFTFNTDADSKDRLSNTVANINLKHTFDSTGKELTADVDYGVFTNHTNSTTATRYYQLNGSMQRPNYILNGEQDGTLTIKSAKVDYVNPLAKKARFEAGIKSSLVSADRDQKFFDVSTGRAINDTTKTNRFYYDEYNNAAYINYSREFKKFNLQFGLRGEQTIIKTLQEKGNVKYDTNYLQLFPSAFFNYNLAADKTFGLSVSRRIDRPGYNQLNPFLSLIDVSTYSTGKPGLLPELTWSYEMSYTMKQLNFTFGYSHTKDVQTIVLIPFKEVFPNIPLKDSNVTVQIPVNLNTSDYVGLTVTAPFKIKKWWNMMNNVIAFYTKYNGNLANTPLNNGTPAARLTSNNTFVFAKGWTSELGLNYSTRVRSGYLVFEPRWGLNAGVQKSLFKNSGSIRFNVTDIFWTNLPKATITYNSYIENWHAYRETRVANLTFTYKFGNKKVADARRRTTASEEERRRAG